MNFPDSANSLVGLIDHLVIIVGAVLLAAVPSWFSHRNHKGIKTIEAQVKNAHTSNLRDDIDRAIHAVEMLGQDVHGLRQDLVEEEQRRRGVVEEIRGELSHVRSELDRRISEVHRRFRS